MTVKVFLKSFKAFFTSALLDLVRGKYRRQTRRVLADSAHIFADLLINSVGREANARSVLLLVKLASASHVQAY
ncbi:hypothetical protein [Undibacterium sp. TJN19]|uniref:hypothetical protein n=1 Tax=Undibacterium sp. TJN19 TaxID=3413055 RepID=UPI003BF39E55